MSKLQGAMHLMGQKLGLVQEIDSRVQLLKRHLPYHESDQVLNLAYNALLDGVWLEDIELRRNDEAFDYQPLKCGRSYRLVVVRKNISVQKGELVLFEDIKYFFYITNHIDDSAEQIVALANERCEQENVIEQLKNGVNAMRMPVDDLLSNWAYMVMSALAWNLKAWYGLLMPNRERGLEFLRMEFRRFLHLIVMLPAQIVRSGRRIIYRIMGYNDWLKDFFATWEYLRRMAPA